MQFYIFICSRKYSGEREKEQRKCDNIYRQLYVFTPNQVMICSRITDGCSSRGKTLYQMLPTPKTLRLRGGGTFVGICKAIQFWDTVKCKIVCNRLYIGCNAETIIFHRCMP